MPRAPKECIFCKIGKGEMKGEIIDKDDKVFVLKDIRPQAPVHLLVMPYAHYKSVAHMTEDTVDLMSRMTLIANKAAKTVGIADKGYRLVINCGDEGGQTVAHLHMHVLGGRQMLGNMG